MRLVILLSICVLLSSCTTTSDPTAPAKPVCIYIGSSMQRCELKDLVCIIYNGHGISCIPKIDLEDRN